MLKYLGILFAGEGDNQGCKTLEELHPVEEDCLQTQQLPALSPRYQGSGPDAIVSKLALPQYLLACLDGFPILF